MKTGSCRRLGLGTAIILFLGPVSGAKTPPKLGVTSFPPELAAAVDMGVPGAPVFLVAPRSAAGKAGLKPGDVITRLGEQTIERWADLARALRSLESGKRVALEFRRDGQARSAEVTLSGWIGEPTDASYRAAADYLRGVMAKRDVPAIRKELIAALWQSGDRLAAVAAVGEAIDRFPAEDGFLARRLELLLMTGQYDVFATEAMALAAAHPESTELGLQKVEALLATGNLAEAETLALAVANQSVKLPFAVSEISSKADRAWAIARLRQGKSLLADNPKDRQPGWRFSHPELSVFAYWREVLGERAPYRVDGAVRSTQMPFRAESVLFGLAPHKMHGITVQVNGVEVPLAIVDTGASHTLIGNQVAKEAKVTVGGTAREAVGSLSFSARPGVIDELRIGDIVLRDVPVSVGNPPPLVMTKAKMAIGVDIMHHLRFHLDYKDMLVKVDAEPPYPAAGESPSEPKGEPADDSVWDIPLWTFADHVLSQARLPDGSVARTLIDSGNFAQTLCWPTWAKMHLPNHPGETGSIFAYAMTNPQREIEGLSLGGRKLPPWPVMDMPPVTLQGVDLLDLLMGHDLLSQYRVTIDMRARRLRLKSDGDKFQPPVAKRPFSL